MPAHGPRRCTFLRLVGSDRRPRCGSLNTMRSDPTLVFGTDGSCLRNPDGPTGWAYICQDGRYAFGGRPAGTNQIGELMAILTVLRDFTVDPLQIQSDSAYAIGCSSTWKGGWQRAGYVRRSGPIANLDLIQEIHTLLDSRVNPVAFVKVKAHLRDETVHPLNVRADELAGRGARAAQQAVAHVAHRGVWPTGQAAVIAEPLVVPPPVVPPEVARTLPSGRAAAAAGEVPANTGYLF